MSPANSARRVTSWGGRGMVWNFSNLTCLGRWAFPSLLDVWRNKWINGRSLAQVLHISEDELACKPPLSVCQLQNDPGGWDASLVLSACGDQLLFVKQDWSLSVQGKWKALLWKIMLNSLPTGEEAQKRNLDWDYSCGFNPSRIYFVIVPYLQECGLLLLWTHRCYSDCLNLVLQVRGYAETDHEAKAILLSLHNLVCLFILMEFATAAGTYWRQRAKLKWNCEGDTCTKYFFNWVKGRYGANTILGIKKESDEWTFDMKEIGGLFLKHFSTIFKSDAEPECFDNYMCNYGYLFDNLKRKLGFEERAKFGCVYSRNEVRQAVFQLGPLKSPGPDGMPTAFYQRYWAIVKKDVINGALNILNSGNVIKEFNKTFIVLIPKNDCPERVGDFRSISLCNVIMKVVTKCIANRLKGIMDDLVGPFQSAFVPNKSIVDNIVIAQEILHVINHRNYGKKCLMAVKADMSKAYDRLNWNFIKGVLSSLNLSGSMVHLIMSTIETVTYDILINGAPLEKFKPRCGIRQGDPLSPYIFALCTEVISQMILYAQDVTFIKSTKICKNGPDISHLLFADDSLFFIRGDFWDLDFLMNIIDEYSVASGQCINTDKSSIIFSPNCSLLTVKKCLTEYKFAPKHDLGNYLGLPTSIGSSKRDLFKFLVDKTKRRLSSWNNILLFSADFLSRPVEEGGLGLRNIGCFNQALLAKSARRILSVPESLISKVIGPKLGVQNDPFFQNRWKTPQASSWALKSLIWGSDLIFNNIAWTIGSSYRLNDWTSRWIEGCSLRDLCGDIIDAPTNAMFLVGDLHDNHRRWDFSSFGFDPGEGVKKKILATFIPCQPSDDSFYWKLSRHGDFTVKSGYYAAAKGLSIGSNSVVDRSRMSTTIVTFCKSKLWKLPISIKLRVFLWKFMANALPVGSEFLKRNMHWRSTCSLCEDSSPCVESLSHLFRDCSC
ncbi:uncharacterized protein LOC141641645 [Silene latifolia]|uniref:uncharacterized protein LOC141641645 n=1 Tax=Silene latifolia TaxID=37657 RepID=UPI003D76DF96